MILWRMASSTLAKRIPVSIRWNRLTSTHLRLLDTGSLGGLVLSGCVDRQPLGAQVALADLVVFTRQLATMIDAGLAMVQSLQALAEQTTNKVMRDIIKDICTRVEGGDSFSEALQKHPKVFNRLYVCMVGAGERGGLLAEILARLATYLENTARLRKKVKSAMMYPTVVTIVAILITIFLLVKVVPVFAEVYKGFGQKLPGPTLALISVSKETASGAR